MTSTPTNKLHEASQRLAVAFSKHHATDDLLAAIGRLSGAVRHAAGEQTELMAACDAIGLPIGEPCDLVPSPTISAAIALRTNLLAWRIERDTRPAAVVGALAMLAALAAHLEQAAPDALEQILTIRPATPESAAVATEIGQQLAKLLAEIEQPDVRSLPELGALLNPDSGHHPIPGDMREIRAALRAGEESWYAQPYYHARYPERGIRFTHSDSCWLTTLCELPDSELHHHISWLGRVLAARGMPRFLLEQHLALLHRELVAAVPERASAYAPLAEAAERLGAERRQFLGDAALEQLETSFDAAVGAELAAQLPHIGQLIGAAITDERAGIANAASSLLGWLVDPVRFPQHWCEAVTATALAARSS